MKNVPEEAKEVPFRLGTYCGAGEYGLDVEAPALPTEPVGTWLAPVAAVPPLALDPMLPLPGVTLLPTGPSAGRARR